MTDTGCIPASDRGWPRCWLWMTICLAILLARSSGAQAGQPPRSALGLNRQQEFLAAQTRNQEAQATYYGAQSPWLPPVLAFFTSLVGTLAGFLGVYLGFKNTARVERDKWEENRRVEEAKRVKAEEAEFQREIRLAKSNYLGKAGTCAQSWIDLLWLARHTPDRLSLEVESEYSATIRKGIVDLTAAYMLLIALDNRAGQEVDGLYNSIHALDTAGTTALQQWRNSGEVECLDQSVMQAAEMLHNLPACARSIALLPLPTPDA